MNWTFRMDSATVEEIESHLRECDARFDPPLSRRVDLHDFAAKIQAKATRFEAWSDGQLVALVSAYFNDPVLRTGVINHVGTSPSWMGHGLATDLLGRCVVRGRQLGFSFLELEVSHRNSRAIQLYQRVGFERGECRPDMLQMKMRLRPPPCEEKR